MPTATIKQNRKLCEDQRSPESFKLEQTTFAKVKKVPNKESQAQGEITRTTLLKIQKGLAREKAVREFEFFKTFVSSDSTSHRGCRLSAYELPTARMNNSNYGDLR